MESIRRSYLIIPPAENVGELLAYMSNKWWQSISVRNHYSAVYRKYNTKNKHYVGNFFFANRGIYQIHAYD